MTKQSRAETRKYVTDVKKNMAANKKEESRAKQLQTKDTIAFVLASASAKRGKTIHSNYIGTNCQKKI